MPGALQSIAPLITYVAATLLLFSVVAFYINRFKGVALLTIANIIFWLVASRHIINLWRDHINGFKSLWLISGALLILTSTPHYQKYQRSILWLNLIILCLFFVDCGIAHFNYADFVISLIPNFIPFRTFFSYFAGVCPIAGGVGLLVPRIQKWAALLSGIQITGWFLLLHLPRAITIGTDEWIGVGESLAVAGICFMLYGKLNKKKKIG
jgi:uncharacterized membrane protein YphA (DoxX/SURF4 family)